MPIPSDPSSDPSSDPNADVPWLDGNERHAWLGLIWVATRLLPSLDAQLERDAGLNFFEYSVLAMLREQPDHQLRMTELARVTSASLSRLSHVAKRLEQAGLLRREVDPHDGRCTIAVLTDPGARRVDAAAPGHVQHVRRLVFDALSDAQVEQLSDVTEGILGRLAPGSSVDPFPAARPAPR